MSNTSIWTCCSVIIGDGLVGVITDDATTGGERGGDRGSAWMGKEEIGEEPSEVFRADDECDAGYCDECDDGYGVECDDRYDDECDDGYGVESDDGYDDEHR